MNYSLSLVWCLTILAAAVILMRLWPKLPALGRGSEIRRLKLLLDQCQASQTDLQQQLTETRAILEESQGSQKLFRAMLDNAFQCHGLLSPHGRVIESNRTSLELIGAERADVIGQYFWDTPWWSWDPVMREEIRRAVVRAAGGEFVRLEATHRDLTGVLRTLDFSLTPIFDGESKVVYLVPEGRDITERKRIEAQLRSLNEELERRVAERTSKLEVVNNSLVQEIEQRRVAQEEILLLNNDLQDQKRALELANLELESFNYSVTHDLKAPLRHIDGFSRMLQEECRSSLDETQHEYLMRIRRGCQRMGELIGDLFHLSQVSRAELRQESVVLGAIAREIAEELQQTDHSRTARFVIDDAAAVHGDPNLLRIALENLLSNAWKYSSTRDVTVIEFGARSRDDLVEYFVKDNGVGFDMKHADKLFGVFQRLHKAEEFAGTGIGLAIVQRIIHRHGGEIWAEGRVEGGATFFFTTSPSNR